MTDQNQTGQPQSSQPNTELQAFHIDLGHFDLGHVDLGHFDLGHVDLGHFDLGHVDLGHFDLGHFDLGHFDLGHFDLGHVDLGHFDLGHIDLGHFDLGHVDVGHFDLFSSASAAFNDAPVDQPQSVVAQYGQAFNRLTQVIAQREVEGVAKQYQMTQVMDEVVNRTTESIGHLATATSKTFVDMQSRINSLEARLAELERRSKPS